MVGKEEAKDNKEEGKVIVTGFHGFEIEYNGIWVDVKYKGESLKGVIKASVAAFDPEDMEDILPVLTLRIVCEDMKEEKVKSVEWGDGDPGLREEE